LNRLVKIKCYGNVFREKIVFGRIRKWGCRDSYVRETC
jgi:hypothetical protein